MQIFITNLLCFVFFAIVAYKPAKLLVKKHGRIVLLPLFIASMFFYYFLVPEKYNYIDIGHYEYKAWRLKATIKKIEATLAEKYKIIAENDKIIAKAKKEIFKQQDEDEKKLQAKILKLETKIAALNVDNKKMVKRIVNSKKNIALLNLTVKMATQGVIFSEFYEFVKKEMAGNKNQTGFLKICRKMTTWAKQLKADKSKIVILPTGVKNTQAVYEFSVNAVKVLNKFEQEADAVCVYYERTYQKKGSGYSFSQSAFLMQDGSMGFLFGRGHSKSRENDVLDKIMRGSNGFLREECLGELLLISPRYRKVLPSQIANQLLLAIGKLQELMEERDDAYIFPVYLKHYVLFYDMKYLQQNPDKVFVIKYKLVEKNGKKIIKVIKKYPFTKNKQLRFVQLISGMHYRNYLVSDRDKIKLNVEIVKINLPK